jgi:predicted MFS family arabinose efflux permease
MTSASRLRRFTLFGAVSFAQGVLAFVVAVGIGLGQPLSGLLTDAFGFSWMFAVLAALNLLTLPVVYGIFRLRDDIG